MPSLTRKRVNDRPESWHVHFAGVRVGMIVERSGVANTAEPFEFHLGFYPGGPHGQHKYGRAESFEAARAAFEAAWRLHLPKCTEAGFQEWRDHEAWTAEKYGRFDRHERMPPDWRARCLSVDGAGRSMILSRCLAVASSSRCRMPAPTSQN